MAQNNDQILSFLDDNQTLNQKQKNKVTKFFQVSRANLQEYDVLRTGKNFDFNMFPNPHEPVEQGRRPLIPMMISLVPPDIFPSGETDAVGAPAPSETPIRLTEIGSRGKVESESVPEEPPPKEKPARDLVITPQALLFGDSTQLNASFRTEDNVEVNGPPVNWSSSAPDIVKVDDSGNVTFGDEPKAASITAQTTLNNGESISRSVAVATSQDLVEQFSPNPEEVEPADPEEVQSPAASEGSGLPPERTTEVSRGASFDSQQFLNSQTERYLKFRNKQGQALRDLNRNNSNIREDGDVIEDFTQQDEQIRKARIQGENGAFLRGQIEAMKSLPPLIMYINPSEFSISYEHIMSDGSRSREGYIVEHWGLQQPRISASGSIGATMINATNDLNRPTGGVTRMLRRGSAAYQHFMNLFQMYKNNAYIYNVEDTISLVGSVKIFYDDTIYTGSFDSLSMNESEDTPYNLEYDFEFTVRFEDQLSRTTLTEGP